MNKKHIYRFGFADLNISLKTEWPVDITKNFKPFLIQQMDKVSDGIFEYQASDTLKRLSLIHISEPTRLMATSRMPSSA